METLQDINTQNISSNNKRIAKNTMYLYIRMFVILIVSLYTSRVILKVLGASDYGIYNIIGGVVVLFSFINGALTAATQRYLNFYIGRNDLQKTHDVFCMSMNIYIVLSGIFIILAETIGLWFVNTQLNIPDGRMYAGNWIYQFTVFSFMLNLTRIPYNASLIAYEKMVFYAYLSLLDVTIKLIIVYLLYISPIDKMIAYGFLFMLTDLLDNIIYRVYCKKKIRTASYHWIWDKELFKELLSFSSWSLFGNAANIVAQQGLNILVNIFYGVTLNAALGIANQVASKVVQFFSNFQTAFSPQLVKYYAEGQTDEFFKLIFRTSRLSYFLMLLISFPLILKIDVILDLWLVDVPKYTGIFCQLILIFYLIEALSGPLWMSIQATGNIKNYQIMMSLLIIANIPFIYICLKTGMPVWTVWGVRIIIDIITFIVRCIYLKEKIHLPLKKYTEDVLWPVFLSTILILPLPIIFEQTVDNKYVNFIGSMTVSLICTALITFYIGLKRSEREKIVAILKKRINK